MLGINEFLTKLFGNKSQRDLKEITPWVDKVKAVYPSIQALSNDELRARVDVIKQRIQDYFAWTISAEVKPSFASLALAIGVDRKTLLSWENEETRKGSGYSDIIKKAKSLITSIVEDNGTEGRVNPVYTMFLLNSSAQGYSNNSRVEITSSAPAEQISAPSMDDIIDIYSDAGDTADPE